MKSALFILITTAGVVGCQQQAAPTFSDRVKCDEIVREKAISVMRKTGLPTPEGSEQIVSRLFPNGQCLGDIRWTTEGTIQRELFDGAEGQSLAVTYLVTTVEPSRYCGYILTEIVSKARKPSEACNAGEAERVNQFMDNKMSGN